MRESSAARSIGQTGRGDKKKVRIDGGVDQVSGVAGRMGTAKCHCEERSDEAISILGMVDCFASLAMTWPVRRTLLVTTEGRVEV